MAQTNGHDAPMADDEVVPDSQNGAGGAEDGQNGGPGGGQGQGGGVGANTPADFGELFQAAIRAGLAAMVARQQQEAAGAGEGLPTLKRPAFNVNQLTQNLDPYENRPGQKLDEFLSLFKERCTSLGLPETQWARALLFVLKGEPVTWLRNVPDYKTMPWERLEKLFLEHWHAKVRTTAAEARMQLHHGRHAMREHERIIVYKQQSPTL